MTIKADSIVVTEIQLETLGDTFFDGVNAPMLLTVKFVMGIVDAKCEFKPKTKAELSKLLKKFKVGKHLTEITL